MSKKIAGEKLLEYNYINLITPYKHNFAKTNEKKEVIKVNGEHIYERNVEFSEYYGFCFSTKIIPSAIRLTIIGVFSSSNPSGDFTSMMLPSISA